MKYIFQDVFAAICSNSGINNVWVLDANHAGYFRWTDGTSPRRTEVSDAEKICVAAAAQAKLDESTGVCVFPTASGMMESLAAIYDLNQNKVPMLLACLVDDFDIAPESILLPLLKDCEIFTQFLADSVDSARLMLHALQYAVSERKVAVLLIGRHLLEMEPQFMKGMELKALRCDPVITPSIDRINELASVLNQTDKITILCGRQSANAISQIEALSQKLKSPIVFAPGSRAVIDSNVSYSVGIYGKWAEPSAYNTIGDSEMLILLDFFQKDLSELDDKVKVVQISPYSMNSMNPDHSKLSFHGDVRSTLDQVLPLIMEKSDQTFLNRALMRYKDYKELLSEEKGYVPGLLRKIKNALNHNISRCTCLCAEGYHSYFFKNILVDDDVRRFICNFHPLGGVGNTIFMSLGMQKSDSEPQVIGIIDTDQLMIQISNILPLENPDNNLKIIAISSSKDNVSTLADLCNVMKIEHHLLKDDVGFETGIKHWLNYEHSSILEVYVDLPDDLLIRVKPNHEKRLPDDSLRRIFPSLNRSGSGYVFSRRSIVSQDFINSEYGACLKTLLSDRNIFYAASGAECYNDKVSVCLANSLQEVLRMMPGIYEVKRLGLPMLFIVFLQTEEHLDRILRESYILHKLLKTISGYHKIGSLGDKLDFTISEAIAEAKQSNTLSTLIFQNIWKLEGEPKLNNVYASIDTKSVSYPSEEEMSELARIINISRHPVILAGGECRNAHKEVLDLSMQIKAPLGWTFKSKDLFDCNPYPIGMPGLLSSDVMDKALRKCDLLLLLGIEFPFDNEVSEDARIIQIDINRIFLGLTHRVDMGLVGDIKSTIERLLPIIKNDVEADSFVESCRSRYEREYNKYMEMIDDSERRSDGIALEGVIARINRYAPSDSWITADMVLAWYMSAMILDNKQGGRRFFSSGDSIYNCNSSAFCMGAGFADNEASMVVITTNISFRKQIDNLRNIVRTKNNLKIFVLHLWDKEPSMPYSRLFKDDNLKEMVITSRDDLSQRISLLFSMKDFVIVDIYAIKMSLVSRHRRILEDLYSKNNRNLYMKTLGLLPPELIDDEYNI